MYHYQFQPQHTTMPPSFTGKHPLTYDEDGIPVFQSSGIFSLSSMATPPTTKRQTNLDMLTVVTPVSCAETASFSSGCSRKGDAPGTVAGAVRLEARPSTTAPPTPTPPLPPPPPLKSPKDSAASKALLEEIRKQIAAARSVLPALKKEHPGVVAKALKKLFEIMDEGDTYSGLEKSRKIKKYFIKMGVPSMVVSTMQQWRPTEKVQLLGSACLSRLAFRCDAGAAAIAAEKGVEAISAALVEFSFSLRTQKFGCAALLNIFGNYSSKSVQGASQKFVDKLNGLRLIKKAMMTFQGDASLQARCCGLYSNIARNKVFHKALLEVGVIAVVDAALKRHHENTKVKDQASGFMENMDRGNNINIVSLL